MNCPSRVDPVPTEGWNQNPDALSADTTTRADFNHIASARLQRDHRIDPADGPTSEIDLSNQQPCEEVDPATSNPRNSQGNITVGEKKAGDTAIGTTASSGTSAGRTINNERRSVKGLFEKAVKVLRKYAQFIGPGFMVAVAYIDPGAYPFTTWLLVTSTLTAITNMTEDMWWTWTVGSRNT